jgi:DNA/RNA endonuclease YhcR with UshA esterase domain
MVRRERAGPVQTKRIAAAAAMLGLVGASAGAAELGPGDAARHVGETATVCGVVASAKYLERSATKPTLLNLGEPYPDEIFTVVIFGRDRAKFGTPETTLKGRRVCATGKIEEYRGVPEIVLADPQQLKQ